MSEPGSAFYFDLAAPEAYLVAERILQVMPVATPWVPVLDAGLPGGGAFEGFRCAAERDIAMQAVERTAAERGLQPVRWPEPLPFDSVLQVVGKLTAVVVP